MNTIYCYDRFARAKRLALGVASVAIFGALSLVALRAQAAPSVERLPTVTVTAKRAPTKVEQLPAVVIVAQRAGGASAYAQGGSLRSLGAQTALQKP